MNSELEKIAYMYGDILVRRKKERRKRQKLLVIEMLSDYAKNSTLHGLRYIADYNLSVVERLFWFLTVIASFLLCSFYIYNVVYKWRTSPVIVTVSERLKSVGSVPFPSVTICSQKKVNPYYYNYTEKLKLFENESLRHGADFTKYNHINAMCDDMSIYFKYRGEPEIQYTNSSMVDDIIQAAPRIKDLCFFGNWYDYRFLTCDMIFSRVITEDGVCYTANSLAANDIFEDTIQQNYAYMETKTLRQGWSFQGGYNYSYRRHHPRRGQVYRSMPDLSFMIASDREKGDWNCNNLLTGYKIYLHHPADYPQSSLYSYNVLPNQLASIAINFDEFNSDSDLASYDVEIRQCYYPSERKLRYFKIYTMSNCQAECLSNYTYRICKCVGFYMPHHNSSEICHPDTSKICIATAKDEMTFCEKEENLSRKVDDVGWKDDYQEENQRRCSCLPACNTIEYDAEVLSTRFRMHGMLGTSILGYSKFAEYSKVDLFFKKPQFVTMQRRELFGVTDMLANIGGLLGLFLGFSFLSLIEIFYFSTVRVGFILKRDLDEEKSKKKPKKGLKEKNQVSFID